jgi:single-strand DNA-binding protein
MSGINKMMVLGRIVKDPELKSIPNGTQVCEFTVVTNERYTDKAGNKQEETEFTNFTAWGKQAEIIANNKKKGDEIFIIAKKKTKTWDKDGQKQYKTEFIVSEFEFIGGNKNNSNAPSNNSNDDDLPF